MKNYYLDNSIHAFENRYVMVTEKRFRQIQDNFICDGEVAWNHHWLSFEARNREEAIADAHKFFGE